MFQAFRCQGTISTDAAAGGHSSNRVGTSWEWLGAAWESSQTLAHCHTRQKSPIGARRPKSIHFTRLPVEADTQDMVAVVGPLRVRKGGLLRELSPRPLAPGARIMP